MIDVQRHDGYLSHRTPMVMAQTVLRAMATLAAVACLAGCSGDSFDVPSVLERISVTVLRAGDSVPLAGLEVHVTGYPDTYVSGRTASDGKAEFYQVAANYREMTVLVQGEYANRPYHWTGNVDFYAQADFTLRINPLF